MSAVLIIGGSRGIGLETVKLALRAEFRVQLTIKNPLIEDLMLWSHCRCDVVRVEVLCSDYPGAEN